LIMAHILIVEARFYDGLLDALQEGARAALTQAGATFDIVQVPGALEIPGTIAMAAKSGRYDGYVALGVVLRGETTHYDIVAGESARAIMDLTVQQHLCIGNGILTCENERQAWDRAKIGGQDKGGGAAKAALQMLELRKDFGLTS
jgi:6,7-dimethyl-8-ribityllumazine synthase